MDARGNVLERILLSRFVFVFVFVFFKLGLYRLIMYKYVGCILVPRGGFLYEF